MQLNLSCGKMAAGEMSTSKDKGCKYILVEWDVDSSISVIHVSKLKSRDKNRVTQKWPSDVFSGVILRESGE